MGSRDEDYTAFVTQAWPRLFRTAYALTGDVVEAEDLLQTALTKVYVSWHRVEKADAPDAYVRRTLVNQLVSWRRRPGRRAETTSAMPPERLVDSPEFAVTETMAMWEALQRLPAPQRAVVVLRFYEDMSERDIAEVMRVAPGTVKSRCSTALAALRAILDTSSVDSTGEVR